MPEQLVIIGGVAAGMSAASKARRLRPDLAIVVYEQSGYVSYGACGFPYYIKGEIPHVDNLIARTPQQFAQQNIQVQLHHQVRAIDPQARLVHGRNLSTGADFTQPWDKLIITAGSTPTRPPVPGFDLPGSFTLRSVEDALAIRRWLEEERPRHGVIVGAGYIGLEMAEALAAHGVTLTLLDLAPQVLPLLDNDMAAHVQTELERQGVAVQLGQAITALAGNGQVREVVAGNERFPAEIVIFGVGVKPNVQMAREIGIALGPTGAIAVDQQQCTNLPNIWAAGDVAEAYHRVTGRPSYVPLGTTANKQGRVAGTNAAGGNANFAGIVGTALVKVFDLHVASTGLSAQRAAQEGFKVATVNATVSSRAEYMPGHQPIQVKLVFEHGSQRLLGAQLIGREGVSKRIDVVAAALHNGWTTYDLAELDLGYAPPFAPVWDPLLVAANLANR